MFFLSIAAGIGALRAEEITKTFPVVPFSAIEANSNYQITVTRAAGESLSITAEKDVMKYIIVGFSNGVLKLTMDRNALPRSIRDKRVKANITMPNLTRLEISGACTFTSDSKFSPTSFKASASGASVINNLIIDAPTISVEVSGASRASISGSATNAKYTASGASKIEITQNVSDLDATSNGASKLTFTGSAANMKASVSGASTMNLTGSSNNMKIGLSGASKCSAAGFNVQNLIADISGASKLEINVSETLKVDVGGGSSMSYSGNPQILKQSVSSGASLKKR